MKKAAILLGVSGLMLGLLVVAGVYAQGPTASSPPGLEGSIQASGDTINFQGRLYTASGAPVPAGNYNMRFTVCSASDCSSTVWGPTEFTAAVDSQGLFNVLLTSFNANHFTGDRWLRIQVCNTANQNPCTSGWDTMTPYQPMTSVAIAIGNIRKNIQDSTTASVAGSYVLLVNNTGSGWGIQGQSVSDSGVYGVSTSGSGVEGYASSTTADVDGVFGRSGAGTFYRAPAGVSTGATGSVTSPGDYGLFGINSAASSAYGVVGSVGDTIYLPPSGYGAGVLGSMNSATGFGVFGRNNSTTGGSGVYGLAGTTNYTDPSAPVGVAGKAGTASGIGVWGYSESAGGGWGVVGAANGTTGSSSGVLGINAFAAGAGQSSIGVVGVAGTSTWTYFTGAAMGVLGSVARTTDYGVFGYNSAATGGTGVQGQGFIGVVGYSPYARGVFGQTNYTSYTYGQAVVGYASATGVAVHGVYGVAGTTTWTVPSGPAGVAGCVASSTGYGVWGYNNDSTGGWGLYGRGYYGAQAYSPYYVGAYARSDSSSGWGLAGHNYWGGVGVGAWSYSGDILRGYSGDFPGGTLRLYLTNAGSLYVDGNYYTFLNPPGDDPNSEQTVLSAVMSTEVWFEDFGTATLSDGRAVVTIAPDFASTVNLSEDYHVFLTPLGECQGLYVARKTPTNFEVRELGGGKANIAFDYRIVAKRLGYEGLRMQPPPEPSPPEKGASPQEPVATATAVSVGVEGGAAAQVPPAQSSPAVAVPVEPKR